MKKVINLVLIIFLSISTCGYKRPDAFTIDAEKNAFIHNNMALRYLSQDNYAAAITEFNIAIALNPNTQATAVYYNNLGEVYLKIGMYQNAQTCFEKAIRQYSLNLLYYKNLAKCYHLLGQTSTQLKKYSSQGTNPMNTLMVGLLYVESGDIKSGIIKLDEFCMLEPKLIITNAVKNYIKELVKQSR